LGAALLQRAWPVGAQPARRKSPFRIVVFPDLIPPIRKMLSDSMLRIGWVEGREVIVQDSGVPSGSPVFQEAVGKVVGGAPDLILTFSSNYALALHRATKTIPVVMWTCGYPVEVGVAQSLARPGKNVTGNTQYAGTGVWGKMLEMLKEAKPGVRRVGVYWGYVPPAFPKEEIEPCYRELREAGAALGLQTNIVEVATPEQIPAALTRIAAGQPDALLVTSSPLLWDSRATPMEFANNRRLPTIVDFPWPPSDGPHPLLTLAPRTEELIGQAVATMDRIRLGARPGDLPIQQPAKFEILVNQKTAAAINLRLPQGLLLRADRVIE
jgi:putative ABC transport system substrate-binding protein